MLGGNESNEVKLSRKGEYGMSGRDKLTKSYEQQGYTF